MKYGSTFTGVGGFELGISSIFPDAKCVYYSENNKFAEKTYLKNFPKHTGLNLGDIERSVFDVTGTKKNPKLIVNELRVKKLFKGIDMLVGGPPCQDLSIANRQKGLGLAGPKSKLFYAFLAIKNVVKPEWFLMENVATMSHKNRDMISDLLDCDPVEICVDRFTPQKRRRLYWFNWEFDINLLPKKGTRWPELVAWSSSNDYDEDGNHLGKRERETRDGRANTLTTGSGCGSQSSKNFIRKKGAHKKHDKMLPPILCEDLQGLPFDWTEGVSETNRYKQIGNAVNPDTLREILKQCPANPNINQTEMF